MTQLVVSGVSKTVRKRLVLDDVSFTATDGEVIGFTGPNGSGKSMLLRTAVGLVHPDSGFVAIDGSLLGIDCDVLPSVGLLIDGPSFLGGYTGLENLAALHEISYRGSIAPVEEALERVALDPRDARRFDAYSQGMAQRLGIAAAIMDHPSVVVLDEPTNALDEEGVELVKSIIGEEARRGAIVLLASHDRLLLQACASVWYGVHDGRVSRLVQEGEPCD